MSSTPRDSRVVDRAHRSGVDARPGRARRARRRVSLRPLGRVTAGTSATTTPARRAARSFRRKELASRGREERTPAELLGDDDGDEVRLATGQLPDLLEHGVDRPSPGRAARGAGSRPRNRTSAAGCPNRMRRPGRAARAARRAMRARTRARPPSRRRSTRPTSRTSIASARPPPRPRGARARGAARCGGSGG